MNDKVFIGGSRSVVRLPREVAVRLDRIVALGMQVLIGDAGGADRAVQAYLSSLGYSNVHVFCAIHLCRNNLGQWPQIDVQPPRAARGAAFHSFKDRKMAELATVGLMIWDGRSLGTLMNVFRLAMQGKTTVVWGVTDGKFTNVASLPAWESLLSSCAPDIRDGLEKRIASERGAPTRRKQAAFF